MTKHVLIVGGGVVGCLSALELVRRGWNVTIVDQGVLGGESSWAGGGILFPLLPWNYKEPVNRLALAGAKLYPELSRQLLRETGIDPEYQACGMLIHACHAEDVAVAWCNANNVIVEKQAGNLWLPQVAQARNPRLMQALKAQLELRGVKIYEHLALTPLVRDNRLIAWQTAAGQQFSADAYVLAAGAWSSDLLGAHAHSLEVKPMRGQMLLYKLAPNTLTHMIYSEDFYLIPRRDGHILAGSTVEDVGFDKATTQEVAEQLAAKAKAILPQLATAPVIKHWSGLRPGSPDNIPVIARHPQFENLYLNTGHFRYGVTMAPVSAQLVAALMSGEEPQIDLMPYACTV